MNRTMISKLAIGMTISLTAATVSSFAASAGELRGKQFCEVIISKGRLFEIYNTIDLNDCPQANWRKLSADLIKQETSSSFVILNGPRQYMLDGAKNHLVVDNTTHQFQGLAMRKSGVLELSIRETLYGSKPYHEHHVNQKTTWIYAQGKKIYEIIDPAGNVYVLHSIAISANIRSEKDLSHLDQRLQLPRGWTFKAGILANSNELRPIQQTAILLQDNLNNTYQLAEHDFL